jgi:predicted SAM-dependent methyltransferase
MAKEQGLLPIDVSMPLRRSDLAKLGIRGLQCGSGSTLHRWLLNSDMMQLRDGNGNETEPGKIYCFNQHLYYLQHDQTHDLPIESESFEWVFSEHFIEHVTPAQAVTWLKEVYRVLKPGGVARISTPDLATYISGYTDPEQRFFKQHHKQLKLMGMKDVPSRPAWMINQIFSYYGHRWIYDLDEITLAACSAGFERNKVSKCSYRQGCELAMLDKEIRSDESLYVELRK